MKSKAHQRIIREQKAKEKASLGLFSDKPDEINLQKTKIRQINYQTAEKIILEYEWLGTLPGASFYYGIFFENICGGVCCFVGNGGGPNCAKMYGIKDKEIAYLIRGASAYWTPKGTASKLISMSLKLIKKDYPHIKIAIAYSDTDAGEYGTVYQATNWLSLGIGLYGKQVVSPEGKIYHDSFITAWARKNKTTRSAIYKTIFKEGWTEQKPNRKYRYMYFLCDGKEKNMIYNKINQYITDYPKRPKNCDAGVISSIPSVQGGGGGAEPTASLKNYA